jgi:hypothetical protein
MRSEGAINKCPSLLPPVRPPYSPNFNGTLIGVQAELYGRVWVDYVSVCVSVSLSVCVEWLTNGRGVLRCVDRLGELTERLPVAKSMRVLPRHTMVVWSCGSESSPTQAAASFSKCVPSPITETTWWGLLLFVMTSQLLIWGKSHRGFTIANRFRLANGLFCWGTSYYWLIPQNKSIRAEQLTVLNLAFPSCL